MITKYRQFNESIKSLLVGPSDEEVLKSLKKLKPDIILLKSIENSFVPGIKYAIEKGVNITYDDNKLLKKCVHNNNYDLVKLCLEHGADIHVENDYCIQQSCEYGYYDIVKLCVEYGANIHIDGNYPLLISSAKGFNDIIKLLLDNGKFNKTIISTAIGYAEHNDEHDTVKILRKYYSTINESIKSLLVGPSKEEIWKNLGYEKEFNTPEEFFLYMIDGIVSCKSNKYPNSICWEKNGKTIFEQDFNYRDLIVNKEIWNILKNVFCFDNDEVKSFIKEQVKEHLNWNGFTPHIMI